MPDEQKDEQTPAEKLWAAALAATPADPTDSEATGTETPAAPTEATQETPAEGTTSETTAESGIGTTPVSVNLDSIPQEYRKTVETLIAEQAKKLDLQWKGQFTRKTQELAKEREALAPLSELTKNAKLSPERAAKAVQAYIHIAEGMRTDPEGTLELLRKSAGTEQEPDFDSMSAKEIAAYYDAKSKREIDSQVKALKAEFDQKVEPLVQTEQSRAVSAQLQAWREANKDLSDEDIAAMTNIIRAVHEGSGAEAGVEGLNKIKEALVPVLRARKTSTPKAPVPPTLVPGVATKSPAPKKPRTKEEFLASVPGRLGLKSGSDLDRALRNGE